MLIRSWWLSSKYFTYITRLKQNKNLNNSNTLIEENQKNKLNIIKMTDLFLKVSQIKMTINVDLKALYESKEY